MMSSKKLDNTYDFYTPASDWAYDMYQSQTVWLRRALFGLMTLSILLGLSLTANVFLFPLKEKVPYLYVFDHATGEVTKIGQLEPTTLSADWSLSRYLLIQYVINYESYDFNDIERPYQLVWAQSADNVRAQYEAAVSSSNKDSPYRKYGKEKNITVRVISINRLNDNTVDVKFEKTLHSNDTRNTQVLHKEAIIKYAYTNNATDQKTLDRDPLGFKVDYYQTAQVNLDKNI